MSSTTTRPWRKMFMSCPTCSSRSTPGPVVRGQFKICWGKWAFEHHIWNHDNMKKNQNSCSVVCFARQLVTNPISMFWLHFEVEIVMSTWSFLVFCQKQLEIILCWGVLRVPVTFGQNLEKSSLALRVARILDIEDATFVQWSEICESHTRESVAVCNDY